MNRGIDPGFSNEKIVVNNRDMILRKLDIKLNIRRTELGCMNKGH